ncbi:hypothetical protein [Streptomyces acidicola]
MATAVINLGVRIREFGPRPVPVRHRHEETGRYADVLAEITDAAEPAS